MAETVKTIENVDRLFSQIIVNGEVHESSNYVPPVVPQQNAPVIETPEEQSSQNNNQGAQQSTQGEDVYAVELNDVLHNFVDQAVTQGLAEEVTARENADTSLDERLDTIEAVIPSSATPSNKLADQASIGTIAEEVATQTVNGIIADLDVAEAGGNGKYIKAISESNGKISATEGTIDSSVSSGSENPVTGGAVNTAIESAINALDVSEKGGNGKYIKAISEANGKIVPTEGTIDSSVTSGSGNPVSSDAVSTAIGAIETNVGDIEELIPEQASAENQLADKNFVNSSIASNTANFIGTFESVAQLQAYSGTVTNNDYAFVRNTVVQYNGGDFPNITTLNNYSKTGLTNGDYAWVVNAEDNTKFDLYRFDIVEQTWLLRATKIDKSLDILNGVFNRYKATVSGSTVTWAYEYTLNNSSFTAEQWATINSGLTSTSISDAINALDVSEKGGNGKYIKAISEADGKISATEGTIDSSVASGSPNPVTGGAVYTGLDGKVDKVAGKGLSTNDFTDTLKNKLDEIEAGAQVNSVTGVKGNSESTYRTGNVNITKSNIGLGNVANTGDSDTPVSGGTTKFTTGGAYNLLLNLASVFDTATAYTVGSYVIYNGSLYKCVVDHTAGAWDSTHFTVVNVGDEIEQLNENKASLPTDAVLHYSFDEVPDYPDGTAVAKNLNGDTYDVTVSSVGTITTDAYAEDGKIHKSNVNGNANYKTNVGSNRNLGIYFGVADSTGLVKIIEFEAKTPNIDIHIFYRQSSSDSRTTIYPLGNSISVGKHRLAVFVPQDCFEYSIVFYSYNSDLDYTEWELIGYYLGDGSYSAPIIDNANGQNNATNNGGIAVQGVSGKGLRLLGNGYIDGNLPWTPWNKQVFSVSCWIRNWDRSTSLYLINNWITFSISTLHITFNPSSENKIIIDVRIGSDLYRFNNTTFDFTQLEGNIFVACILNGTSTKLCVNGVSIPLLNYKIDSWAESTKNRQNFQIGRRRDSGGYAYSKADIDDFLIFDRALSEQEVQALYLNKANTPKYFPTPTNEIKQDSLELATSGGVYNLNSLNYATSTDANIIPDTSRTVITRCGVNASNTPIAGYGWFIETSRSGNYITQTAKNNGSSASATALDVLTYRRTAYYTNNAWSWSPWIGLTTTESVETGTVISTMGDVPSGFLNCSKSMIEKFVQNASPPTTSYVQALLQTADRAIYAGTDGGIYKSTNGSTFIQLLGFPTTVYVSALLQTIDGAIYAGTSSNHGIYKSTDGSTFTQLSGFPTNYSVSSLLQTIDGTIYAGALSSSGIYKSTDGSIFTQLSGFPTNYSVSSLLQTIDGTIYVGTLSRGIYKSTDGSTFTQLSGFPTGYSVSALLQTADGAIYAGTEDNHGIYKSTDGSTFTQLSGFPTTFTVVSLLQTADGIIYAGTLSHGIYKATDGSTFTQLSGFPFNYTGYFILQTADGTIYAGTGSHGIYKSALFMELSKTTYANLYAVVGDRYKAKAGVTDNTKFAIPLVGNDDLTYAVKT